jgi:hypothetical protein
MKESLGSSEVGFMIPDTVKRMMDPAGRTTMLGSLGVMVMKSD